MFLSDLIFPRKCPFCRKTPARGELMCRECETSLPYTDMRGAYRTPEVWYTAPLYYTGVVRTALRRFKFENSTAFAAPFARLIAESVRCAENMEYDIAAWVPVSMRRNYTRGYDHGRMLARGVAKTLGCPLERLLRKTRNTAPQTEQADDRARRENARGAFSAVNLPKLAGKRILLIDDVITSGATLEECVQTLKHAGAAGVVCAGFAVTAKNRG